MLKATYSVPAARGHTPAARGHTPAARSNKILLDGLLPYASRICIEKDIISKISIFRIVSM